ncbi:putative stress response RCI peptide [Camillea tinctor]|nr:putative stress response RCI peptide [Camillea tinctor]
MVCGPDLFLGLLAILFPPLAVWVKCGICSADSLINVLLCVLGYIPGLLHAWYVIAKFPDGNDYERVPEDNEEGHVTYVFVQSPGGQPRRTQRQPRPQPQPQGDMDYGTNAGASSSSAPPPGPHHNHNSEGSHGGPAPPSYAEAVQGDNKIQTHD